MFAWLEKSHGTVKLLEVIETEADDEPSFEWLDVESFEDGVHLHLTLDRGIFRLRADAAVWFAGW